MVRGFPLYSDDITYNGLYGFLPRQYLASEFIERLEVFKGANALGWESGNQGYAAVDLARRFGPDENTGIRLNAVRRDGGTAVDDEKRKLSAFGVGLDWRGERARLSADLGWQEHKLSRSPPSVNIAAGLPIPSAPDARGKAGGYKLNFDLHRADGLWVWGIIVVVAFTSFSLNLYRQIFYPVMSLVSQTTPGPYETQTPAPYGTYIEPKLSFEDAVRVAETEAQRRGFETSAGGIYYGGDYPFYNVSFFDPENELGAMGMGLSNLYIDANDGSVLGEHRPWKGTAADVFVQLQLPLHSGRILGMPGRIMMSLMGVLVAMLSVTGIVIWERKRRSRRLRGRTPAS